MPKTIKWKTPPVGSIFKRDFAGKQHTLKVMNSPSGIIYELDGRIFKTPTAAAKSLTKYEVNGWKFWNIKRE